MPEWSKKKGCLVFGWIVIAILVLMAVFIPAEKSDQDEAMVAEKIAQESVVKPSTATDTIDQAKRDELMTVLRQASSATIACKFAVEETINLLGSASNSPENLMKAYTKAHQGEPDCYDAAKDLGQIDRPKLATQVMSNNLDYALDECARAATLRAQALKTVKVALDGDYSFATAQRFVDDAQEARTTHNLCMGSLREIGLESGIAENTLDFLEN